MFVWQKLCLWLVLVREMFVSKKKMLEVGEGGREGGREESLPALSSHRSLLGDVVGVQLGTVDLGAQRRGSVSSVGILQ